MKTKAEFQAIKKEFDRVTIECLGSRGRELLAHRNSLMNSEADITTFEKFGMDTRQEICDLIGESPDADCVQQAFEKWWNGVKHYFGADINDLAGIIELYQLTPFKEALNRMNPRFSDFFSEVATNYLTVNQPSSSMSCC